MRAQRIKTGFHRIGLVLGVMIGVPSLIFLAFGIHAWFTERPDAWELVTGGTLGLIGAGAAQSTAWALGWIIAGFAGDE
jgi:hypothetical protein